MLFGQFRQFVLQREESLIKRVSECSTSERIKEIIENSIKGEFSLLINELNAVERDVLSTLGKGKE